MSTLSVAPANGHPSFGGVDAVRADGGLVHIRPFAASDANALRALHARVSDRSMYLRFFGLGRSAGEKYVTLLMQPASPSHQTLTAWIGNQLVGVAGFERSTGDAAEAALLVADDRQHQGIGTLLLEYLADVARRNGIHRFEADVLDENLLALRTLRDLGCTEQVRFEAGTARVVIDLSAEEESSTAIGARERSAEEVSLRHLLAPASIAVIGAGDRPESVGHQVLRNILVGGYTGAVYPVNPQHESVLGLPCVASARDLPVAADVAVIAVPADRVAEVVQDCGERGVHGLILLTAGFGETGDAGMARQDEVVGIARGFGMRILGPNCLGLVNTDPAIHLNATFAGVPMRPGRLGLISQSGALGIAVVSAAARWGLGISQFVSVGNRADVSNNDLLLAWERDEHTRVIALYVESVGNPRKFARIARRVAASKPIIAIKAGRSPAGQRAGLSHTAAAAASDVVVDALFTQAGVLRVDTMEQMLDAARVLCDQPLPRGNRVAVVGNSGGPGILAADAAGRAGLDVVTLQPETEQQLRQAVPTAASCRNPVDLGAAVRPAQLDAALRLLLDAAEVDAVLPVLTDTAVTNPDEVMSGIAAAAAVAAVDKPVVVTRVGGEQGSIPIVGSDRMVPVFTFPEPAAAALGTAWRYSRLRTAPVTPNARPAGIDEERARALIIRALTAGADWLAAGDVAHLLTCYGLPVSPQRVVGDADAAVVAAAELGYPLAVKLAEGGVHKTDVGGVRLGVPDEAELRRVFAELAALCPGRPAVLVQPMTPAGTEVILGAVQDDQFGPTVMIGSGGILADVIADRAFRLAPLGVQDAEDMLADLRTAVLFDGYRGAPTVSRAALADLAVRIGALVDDLPEVAELDLNPVICRGENLLVVDARVRVAAAAPRPNPLLRNLS